MQKVSPWHGDRSGHHARELRHDDALSSCQSRFESLFQLCQALNPSSSLTLIVTFFDSPSVILHHLFRLLACLQRSSMTSVSWSTSASTFFIPGVSVSPLVRLVCEVLWDHALLVRMALVVVRSGRSALQVCNSLLQVGQGVRSLVM